MVTKHNPYGKDQKNKRNSKETLKTKLQKKQVESKRQEDTCKSK